MAQTIESFINRLQQDGVEAGQEAAEKIKSEAEEQARQTLKDAEAEAERILEKARAEAETIRSQVQTELEFSGRLDGLATQQEPRAAITSRPGATGVLPIQIEVPTGGQVYRFARTIIKTEDRLSFSVFYTRLWINSTIKWIIIILIVLIIFLIRKKLTKPWNWCKQKLTSLIVIRLNN